LIARTVAIEITLEAMEADQITGKPIDAEKRARLAGSLARLLDRLGLTIRPGLPAPAGSPPADWIGHMREQAVILARSRAAREGWSDAERDRYAEKLFASDMAAA
jgi:hypothetical protein